MHKILRLYFILLMTTCCNVCIAQEIIEHYQPLKVDSLRVGEGDADFMPYIQEGYTLMLPKDRIIKGVLIFLEDSGYNQKNKSAKQMYNLASEKSFAVLSVSTEIPFDFYFSESSLRTAHKYIKDVFVKYNLPNEHIFFLGASLTGHRALRYIKYLKDDNVDFKLQIDGIVICNFALDWTRKWYQYEREIRIDLNDLWEAKFISYMLETNLKGTPLTVPENYHDFSPYSYFDKKNRNITCYEDYPVRAYIEPAIKFRLDMYNQTMYENSATDIVGFLAELRLAGNDNTDLVVLQPEDNLNQKKNSDATWKRIDKLELMRWIENQIGK